MRKIYVFQVEARTFETPCRVLALDYNQLITVTNHTCILRMDAVFYTPPLMLTIKQRSLYTLTIEFIQPDRTRSLTVFCPVRSGRCIGEAKLTTHYVGIINIPVVVAYCAPYSQEQNLNTTIAISTISQTKRWTAPYADILAVCAITVSPSTMTAIIDVRLISGAGHVIHPNGAGSLAVTGTAKGFRSFWESKLPAHYVSIVDIPTIITNCAPLAITKDLNSTT